MMISVMMCRLQVSPPRSHRRRWWHQKGSATVGFGALARVRVRVRARAAGCLTHDARNYDSLHCVLVRRVSCSSSSGGVEEESLKNTGLDSGGGAAAKYIRSIGTLGGWVSSTRASLCECSTAALNS